MPLLKVENISKAIVRGGWPSSVTAGTGVIERRARDYVEGL